MREAAASLRSDAEAAGEIFEKNLAANAEGVARAFSEAQEKTELSKYDFMDAEGSSRRVNEYLDIAAQSGASVREQMQASLDHAREITAEASAWDKATNSMADNFAGATKSFKEFTAGNSQSSGLAALSGLKTGAGDVGPIASASDRIKASASGRVSRESMGSGRATDPLKQAMQSLLLPEDYMNATTGARSSFDQIQQRMQTRAQQQTARDFSFYTGGDERASLAQATNDLQSKYFRDGLSPSEARSKAERDIQANVNQKLEGTGGTAGGGQGGSSGAGGGGTPQPPKSAESGLLDEIKKLVEKICNERLPIQVLA
jgi:hypothetical protein